MRSIKKRRHTFVCKDTHKSRKIRNIKKLVHLNYSKAQGESPGMFVCTHP